MSFLVVAPVCAAKVLAAWRRSWKRKPASPARRVAGSQTRSRKLLASIGTPLAEVNTNASSPRSVKRRRWRSSSAVTGAGRATSAPGSTLGGALDDLSISETQPLAPDGDDTSGEVDVATAEGEQLAAPKAAEVGDEHHGPVAVRDGVGQAVQLLHGREPLLGVALGSHTLDPAGVLGDPVVVDGLTHDLAEPDVGLGGDRRTLGFAQRGVPGPDQLGGDRRQRPPGERGHCRGDGR